MRKPFVRMLIVCLLGILAPSCYGQSYDARENAVYVFNFIKYTTWPQKKSVIHVGIVGTTSLEEELRYLLSKKINSNTSYTIKKIAAIDAKAVDVIIVSKAASDQLKTIDRQTAHTPVLIISEKENTARLGACISFFIDEDNNYKTGYQLSLRNCKARGLSVSEQIQNNAVLTR